MKNIFLILLGSIFFFSSCNERNLNGVPSQTFDLEFEEEINGIELNIAGDVVIDQNDAQSVVVETQQEVMNYLSYKVENGTLVIELDKNFRNYDFKLYLNVTSLQNVTLNGSGSILVHDLTSDQLKIKLAGSGKIAVDDASNVINTIDAQLDGSGNINIEKIAINAISVKRTGSGNISLYGNSQKLDARLDGSGNLKASQLITKDVTVSNTGSGNVHVHCDGVLSIRNSGSGTIKVEGNPTSIIQL
ncbi:head GIN domain-containing protein [Flammeovirga sp. EKP202]|uniref:head GIN domain-containing protein n=1 Tax=Flammeovirga sp. EKP202 TaxID=2770592 RepID=UPI00165F7BBA|nr:head GIN domain-containing protein [Flammeovirga sp. EKP202]MBD0403133.1 DUF2807 domain-containing protein [Flammeovirga sp. EKP202]